MERQEKIPMSEQQREEQVVQENGMYATSSGISLMEAKLMNYFNIQTILRLVLQ